jgi:methylthioribulose-1-phosphate dehydratase
VTHAQEKGIIFENLEILKGLEGNQDHFCQEWLPIVSNSQNMADIIQEIKGQLSANVHGFLIQGHGLYTWGKDIATAKRHVETYEFLFQYTHSIRSLKWPF